MVRLLPDMVSFVPAVTPIQMAAGCPDIREGTGNIQVAKIYTEQVAPDGWQEKPDTSSIRT